MKTLLPLLLVLVVIWFWRQRQQQRPAPPRHPESPDDPARHMVACAGCGLHLPQGEALQGQHGFYCCRDHLQQDEG